MFECREVPVVSLALPSCQNRFGVAFTAFLYPLFLVMSAVQLPRFEAFYFPRTVIEGAVHVLP